MWRLVFASFIGAAVWAGAYVLPRPNHEQQLKAVVAIATEDSATAAGYAAAYMPEPPPMIADANSTPPDSSALTVASLSRSKPAPSAPATEPATGAVVASAVSAIDVPAPVPVSPTEVDASSSGRFISTVALEGPQPGLPADPAAIRLAMRLQGELRRVGCYRGAIDGDWDAATQRAMERFTQRINASLPIAEPDAILLTLLETYDNRACGRSCRSGARPDANGRCVAATIEASAAAAIEAPPRNKVRVVVLGRPKPSANRIKSRQARANARKAGTQVARIVRRPRYAFTSSRARSQQRIGYGFIGKRLLAARPRRASGLGSTSRARGDGMWN